MSRSFRHHKKSLARAKGYNPVREGGDFDSGIAEAVH